MNTNPEALKNPSLKGLYLYLTEGCNLKCRHCWLSPAYDDGTTRPVMDPHIIEKILLEAMPLGLKKIKLTGGEPLMHPEIHQILDLVAKFPLRLTMETNGYLLNEALADHLARFENPHLSVSLDGAMATTHDKIRGVKGSFDRALQGINNLVARKIRPQIIMTLMQANRYEIEDMVHLATAVGAKSVKFNLVQPASRGEKMHQEGHTISVRELIEIGRFVEGDLSKRSSVPLYYTYPQAFRSLGRIFDDGDCSVCGILNILGVLADGRYALCGVGSVIPEMIMGSAREDSIQQVWRDNSVLKKLREGMPGKFTGICRRCAMKNMCRGACIAQNYYSSRDIWAPFWFCSQAEKEGLFPESRIIPDQMLQSTGSPRD